MYKARDLSTIAFANRKPTFHFLYLVRSTDDSVSSTQTMSSRTTKVTATPATRASTRLKTPATRLQPARTTRAASKTLPKDGDLPAATATPARKLLVPRDNSLETPATVKKTVPNAKAKFTKAVEEADRQPIKVLFHFTKENTSYCS